MSLPYALPMVFGIVIGVTELVIGLIKRSRAGSARSDKGSLWVFWVLIPAGIWFAVYVAIHVRVGRFPLSPAFESAAVALFASGLALRWYSIAYLGRFFTVDVAITADHRLVDTGPYRHIRHPSYTGAMLPVLVCYVYRIRIEEAALRSGLGAAYVDYCARTRRLIPGVF
jgi:protein-S-isoprenylcysteine O-methyltransferase Ste14